MKSVYKRIISMISVLAILSFAMLNIFASNTDAVIIEKNIAAMTNIKDYGPEFVYDYIKPGADIDELVAILDDVKVISDEICKDISDDYDKICAIENYVSTLISYDHDAAHNDVSFDTICLINVLERKRTTCAGYSNLFAVLAQAQGLYCVNIRGSAPDSELGISRDNLADDNTPINHEWNAVWYEAQSRWVYIDCTWNSLNEYENGEFSLKNPVTTYLDPTIEIISLAHKADSVVYRDFFGINPDYYSLQITLATSPAITTAITTSAVTTTSTAIGTSVSQTETSDDDNNISDVPAANVIIDDTDIKDNDSGFDFAKFLPMAFFALGCIVLVSGAVCYFASSRKSDKKDDNDNSSKLQS